MNVNNKAEHNFFKAKKQKFDWGSINWIHEPKDKGKMLIGHVVFLPFKVQGKHLHTGDEQMIYTISGKGEHWINDKYYPLVPGSYYHISAYAEHDIRNTGETPLEMIIVYNTNNMFLDDLVPKVDFIENYNGKSLIDLVDENVLQSLMDDLSKAIDLSIVIQDEKGNALTKLNNFPEFCKEYSKKCDCCHMVDSSKYKSNFKEGYKIESCCSDLVKINAPIYLNDSYIGNIICGPVILNNCSKDIIEKLKEEELEYDLDDLVNKYLKIRIVTKGRLYAIMESLKRINNYIVDMALKRMINEEFQKKSVELLKQKKDKIELEKNLVEAQMKVIQTQISPHFLFNTLSVIGQLAYMKGAKDAADTTFALSSLLRTSLTKAQEFVTIEEEIKYIKDYVFIQNKRFDDVIKLKIDIDDNAKDKCIPFMTIQILVENAIVHGFEQLVNPGEIRIKASVKDNELLLIVKDNGVGISDEAILNFFNNCTSNIKTKGAGIGLNSMYKRLKYYYNNDFGFDIKRDNEVGTIVTLELPLINNRGVVID